MEWHMGTIFNRSGPGIVVPLPLAWLCGLNSYTCLDYAQALPLVHPHRCGCCSVPLQTSCPPPSAQHAVLDARDIRRVNICFEINANVESGRPRQSHLRVTEEGGGSPT